MSCTLIGALLGACLYAHADEPRSSNSLLMPQPDTLARIAKAVDCTHPKARFIGSFSGRDDRDGRLSGAASTACFITRPHCERWLSLYRNEYNLQIFEDTCRVKKAGEGVN